jgi:hypothetical protein
MMQRVTSNEHGVCIRSVAVEVAAHAPCELRIKHRAALAVTHVALCNRVSAHVCGR